MLPLPSMPQTSVNCWRRWTRCTRFVYRGSGMDCWKLGRDEDGILVDPGTEGEGFLQDLWDGTLFETFG